MRTQGCRFSVAVQGRGRFLGMFITSGMAYFHHAVWYDRSEKTNAAIAKEIELGTSPLFDKDSRARAQRAAKNLAKPPPVDVTVTFKPSGKGDRADVVGAHTRRVLLLRFPDANDKHGFDAIDKEIDRIIRAVATVR